ncbi:MAG: protein kinase domain-containing protein [Planctomycetota bacterium]|jgi:serine/threonine protein kinase|nr:protein kinase [Planctomycetaceae bacterium]
MEFTPRSLTQRCVDLELATPAQIDRIWGELRTEQVSLEDVKSILLRKGIITNFQLERMLTGERLGYYYGPYKVLYMIGAGTFARVFRAVHRETGKVVAVKVLRRRHRDQVAQIEQFLREGRMGLELRHPNIVTIYEIVNDPRAPYLVMEFVEGETLREIIKIRGTFEPIHALRIMHDICSGLDFAFQKGITHRDLKLSNVLVHSSGRCKLVDFGLAALADTSSPEAIADCPSARAIDYAALERGTAVRKGDHRSDIYFVGCIFYHIVSGRAPLTETRDRLMRLNVTRFVEMPSLGEVAPGMPESIYAICNKAMEFSPEKRYQTPGQVLADVDTALKKLERELANPGESTEKNASTKSVSAEVLEPEDVLEGQGKTVLVVENRAELQDLLREKLKKRGYRVLVYSDPERALAKFSPDESNPANCLILGATNLGNEALDAFNQFVSNEHTKHLPAILLVDPKQQHIVRGANTSERHVLIPMPLKVRELREALVHLTSKSADTAPQQ